MGSLISLGVENLEIDWGKNNFFTNHSKLFLPNDIKEVIYYYAYGIQEKKLGYCRSLSKVKERLDLLGYSIDGCREIYESNESSIPIHHPYPDENIKGLYQYKPEAIPINYEKK